MPNKNQQKFVSEKNNLRPASISEKVPLFKKRVLAVVLSSGEGELESCLNLLRRQKAIKLDVEVISDLGKQAAHRALFTLFMQNVKNYDAFLKVDADMEIHKPTLISSVLDEYIDEYNIISISVWDYISNRRIQGLNIYSKRCVFKLVGHDPLFTDQVKIENGRPRLKITDLNNNISHCRYPTPEQAFYYGLHRYEKIRQRGRRTPHLSPILLHYRNLRALCREAEKSGATSSQLAVAGAVYAHSRADESSTTLVQEKKSLALPEQHIRMTTYQEKLVNRIKSHFGLLWVVGSIRLIRAIVRSIGRVPAKWVKNRSKSSAATIKIGI